MRWLLPFAAALVVGCGLAGHASASTPTSAQLLARYVPILVLHPDERFQPETVDGYLADVDLVGGHYDQRLCKSVDGPAALDCYAGADAAHAQPPAVYGAVFRQGNRIALEYWLFYAFDLYSPANEIWQDHEGDWEAVTVLLDAKRKPLLVGTTRHRRCAARLAGGDEAWDEAGHLRGARLACELLRAGLAAARAPLLAGCCAGRVQGRWTRRCRRTDFRASSCHSCIRPRRRANTP